MPVLRDTKIGDIVYPAFSPQKTGKIIDEKVGTRQVLVRWATKGNPETWEDQWHLNHLDTLVAETEKKLRNHKARLAKAQAL